MIDKLVIFNKQYLSIGIIWLFHFSGILGIIYSDPAWFIQATPLNLLISFILLLINTEWTLKTGVLVFLFFSVGMVSEILGVQYGLIFGNYTYGSALGFQFMGVPFMIGINWCILVFITGSIAQFFTKKIEFQLLISVVLMLFLDLVMEPVAPQLDFWTFETGLAGVQNYIGWTLVALPLQLIYHKSNVKVVGPFPFHLYLLQILFFTILLLKFNSPPL